MLFVLMIVLVLSTLTPLHFLVLLPLRCITSLQIPWWLTVGAIAITVSWLFGD
ncbi:MAG: hypothetical protein WBA57_12865 [Elainellaceae cyanobacterium]